MYDAIFYKCWIRIKFEIVKKKKKKVDDETSTYAACGYGTST